MIDISPYMQRLEWLKEWMAIKIRFREGGYHYWWYMMVTPGYYQNIPNTFEQFCNYKQSLSKTTK